MPTDVPLIDPHFRIPYFTYILEGLSASGLGFRFKKIGAPAGNGMAMKFFGRNVWLDTDDMAGIEPEPFEWCDLYCKVNCLRQDAASHSKLMPLGPLFGIRHWSRRQSLQALSVLGIAGAALRPTLAGLRFQYKTRIPLSEYPMSQPMSDFVFHRSRRWEGKHASTNDSRIRYLDALRESGLRVDAGLASDRIALPDYLRLTAQSEFVFNSPAVHGCLGWKLGEYLIMSKAILMIDPERELPEALVHGEHVHYVEDSVESITDGIDELRSDKAYRLNLEAGARDWAERNLLPEKVIDRIRSACA